MSATVVLEVSAEDRQLLNLAQEAVALVERPFEILGQAAGMSETEVLQRLQGMKDQKLLRQVGAIFDTRLLGYQSCLAAMKIEPSRLEEAAAIVSAHEGVSHNYERPAEFNLWLTLAVPPGQDLTAALSRLAKKAGALEYALLPAVRMFKIGVKLDLSEGAEALKAEAPGLAAPGKSLGFPDLDDRAIIRVLQEPLPLVPRPWDELAKRVGLSPDETLQWLRKAQTRGWLRRVGALIKHRAAGFSANGMCIWQAGEKMNQAAQQLCNFASVSHCYERLSHPAWPYDLYAMVHGKSEADVQAVADQLTPLLGPARILYSTREFKKTRLRYFCEEKAS